MCQYIRAWIGKCDVPDEITCLEHADLKCDSCGKPATHGCNETMGLVCGAPLCDDCEHETAEDGTNGRTMKHCKKTEQKYTPWYARP